MSDAKTEVSKALEEHRRSFEALHQKLASIAEVDKEKLGKAVAKFRTARTTFEDDAQEFVTH